MTSIKFISLFAVCAFADQSPFDGINCGNEAGSPTEKCAEGLEWVYQDPTNPTTSLKKCCQEGLKSTFDDCKCLPCAIPCDSTASAQQKALEGFKALNFTDAAAKAASETYICADSIFWDGTYGANVNPVFKCCVNVGDDHKCNCPPKDDTKKCYSKWSNPDLYLCNFGKSTSGEYCCRDSSNACKSNQGTVEGFTDWAGCWGSSQQECESKSQQTRPNPDNKDLTQTSGCVWDESPIQKYCGLEVQDDTQCQDARPNFVDNNCGLGAVSDTEWFVNGNGASQDLKFAAVQVIQGATGYCGSHWLPADAKQLSEQTMLV
jgi:hypothetical protein